MKKRITIKKVIIIVCCWIIFYFLFNYIFDEVITNSCFKEIKLLQNINKDVKIKKIIKNIFSFICANLFVAISTYVCVKRFSLEKSPCLHIKILDTMGIRRSKLYESLPQVSIGNGKYCIYIRMSIQNVGVGVIENCKINGQVLQINQINQEQEEFYLKINVENKDLKKENYEIVIDFEDAYEKYYTKKFDLLVDMDNQISNIMVNRKQRRKYKNETYG